MSSTAIHIETSGSGTDMVLIHGWAMHGGIWQNIRDRLSQQFRLHILDLPGHGFSSHREPGDFEHVVSVVQEKLPKNCIVCGWSLGGQVAMELALRDSAQVMGLVLVSTTPCFVKQPDWPWGVESKFLQFFMENLHQNYRTTINRFLTLQTRGEREMSGTLAQLRQYFFERDQPDYDALLKGLLILQTNDMRQKLSQIKQPVLLLHGENDMITHSSAARWMNAQLRHSKLVMFQQCGHAPFLADPDKFISCVNESYYSE
ncbi:carboxylesterase BioH (pimeloyl-CoA synthesis) [Nitrosomonas marina]|uniref:Pimeloyl-[acyl-carrier protein] methyl ester esterase n=1 Tax=Nitrosomonas marina TaxID=917 RepID=A0A1I0ASC9_9PROT|nr:pimeloyl-ACP methyl ester esterase BioH [Nitrosomonas marina]SES97290.1 carboxylesterase BioH (pimeloyl-CoA synthesis) [Nitrosomonas marina]